MQKKKNVLHPTETRKKALTCVFETSAENGMLRVRKLRK